METRCLHKHSLFVHARTSLYLSIYFFSILFDSNLHNFGTTETKNDVNVENCKVKEVTNDNV